MGTGKDSTRSRRDTAIVDGERRRPGRRRSQALDDAILRTALAVLAERGFSRFKVSDVITRSGVSSATLYRRWPTAKDLVVASLRTISPEPLHIDTGTLRGDLAEFLRFLGRAIGRREWLAGAGPSGLSDAELEDVIRSRFLEPRQQTLRAIIERAHRRGELPLLPELEDCWSLVVGPLQHRMLVRSDPVPEELVSLTAEFVAAGLRSVCGGDGAKASP